MLESSESGKFNGATEWGRNAEWPLNSPPGTQNSSRDHCNPTETPPPPSTRKLSIHCCAFCCFSFLQIWFTPNDPTPIVHFCSHGSAAILEEDENGKLYPGHTAILIMAVSPAVLAHEASMRIAALSIGWIYLGPFEKLETVKFRQGSISVQPMRQKVKSLKHVKLRVDT